MGCWKKIAAPAAVDANGAPGSSDFLKSPSKIISSDSSWILDVFRAFSTVGQADGKGHCLLSKIILPFRLERRRAAERQRRESPAASFCRRPFQLKHSAPLLREKKRFPKSYQEPIWKVNNDWFALTNFERKYNWLVLIE